MRRLRYSDIVGRAFYRIALSEAASDMVDAHFTASAHHYHRMGQAGSGSTIYQFHLEHYRAHLDALMLIVFKCGDFSRAKDASLGGFENREAWYPQGRRPSKEMFDSMEPDRNCGLGRYHALDIYLAPESGWENWMAS